MHGICNHSLEYREVVVRLDQTIRNLTFGDVEISLVVIRLRGNYIEKDRIRVPAGCCLGETGRKCCVI